MNDPKNAEFEARISELKAQKAKQISKWNIHQFLLAIDYKEISECAFCDCYVPSDHADRMKKLMRIFESTKQLMKIEADVFFSTQKMFDISQERRERRILFEKGNLNTEVEIEEGAL
jgi:hypothetical protein